MSSFDWTRDEELVDVEQAATRWDGVQRVLMRIGDWLNPILVKETRQAIKSRQFTITFALVLAAGWLWSLGGVALIGPSIFYSAHGTDMFFGYFIILAFPLGVIVPFTAYRSLAGEREENTFELLSIATLTPGQIISGKLGSAVVQILVYFSAVAPCLAFTYLLRGIDILTIGVLLTYAFFASLGLAAVGLLLATTARERFGQVILSVALVILLCGLFFGGIAATEEFLQWGGMLMLDREFWIVNAVIATIYVNYFVMVYLASAARLSFASENRSTKLRIAMLFQQFCFTAWMAWPWVVNELRPAIVTMYCLVLAGHWYVMGLLMTSESPELSQRVQRSLPQSLLGRVLWTWYYPGPGTGYVFALANLGAGLVLALGSLYFVDWVALAATFRPMAPAVAWYGSLVAAAYMAFYLGLGAWILSLLRKAFTINLFAAILIHCLLVLLGTGIPMIIYGMSADLNDYTMLQLTNPFWSIFHVVDRPNIVNPEAAVILLFTGSLAGVCFLLNLPALARELGYVRIAAPQRVEEEDAELTVHEPAVPQSPWD